MADGRSTEWVPHQLMVHLDQHPDVQDAIFTVVTQDQRRTLPVGRLYLYEIITNVSRVERQTRMEREDFNPEDRTAWTKIKQWANGKAWQDYKIKTNMVELAVTRDRSPASPWSKFGPMA